MDITHRPRAHPKTRRNRANASIGVNRLDNPLMQIQ